MKFNLKNRPAFTRRRYPKGTCAPDIEEMLDWFEGFEKQEREKNKITAIKIQELGAAKQIPLERLGFLRGYLQRGKEILGES